MERLSCQLMLDRFSEYVPGRFCHGFVLAPYTASVKDAG